LNIAPFKWVLAKVSRAKKMRLSNITLKTQIEVKGTGLLLLFYISVTVGSSTMRITRTLK